MISVFIHITTSLVLASSPKSSGTGVTLLRGRLNGCVQGRRREGDSFTISSQEKLMDTYNYSIGRKFA